MARASLPYLVSPGTLTTAFQKIKAAATPERFTQDFLATTLGMKGGGAKPIIPFLKRIGFLRSDGTPTDLYKSFRNAQQSGAAVAQAMRTGYKPLFDMNERAHDLSDAELKGLMVQATGLEADSRAVELTVMTFKVLKKHASFGASLPPPSGHTESKKDGDKVTELGATAVHLAYTINLNLPPSSDVAVFNAIFKALRENLLR